MFGNKSSVLEICCQTPCLCPYFVLTYLFYLENRRKKSIKITKFLFLHCNVLSQEWHLFDDKQHKLCWDLLQNRHLGQFCKQKFRKPDKNKVKGENQFFYQLINILYSKNKLICIYLEKEQHMNEEETMLNTASIPLALFSHLWILIQNNLAVMRNCQITI